MVVCLRHQVEKSRDQARLIERIVKASGSVHFHQPRWKIPAWLQRFIKPPQRVQRVVFDFEEHPNLEHFPFEDLKIFNDLEELNLHACGADGEALSGLVELRRFKKIDLGYGRIGDVGYDRLSKFRALQVLNLNAADITDERMRRIGRITTLKSLALSDGPDSITNLGLSYLQPLSELEELDLYGMPITDEGLETVGHFRRLKQLTLTRTKVAGPGLAHLRSCPELADLRLDWLPIDNDDLRFVGELTSLTHLNLISTSITDGGLVHLKALKNLQTLWLNQTAVTPSAVEDLKQSLPNLTFVSLGRL